MLYSTRMIVGLDIDGVLADFLPPFLKLLEARAGRGPIEVESITDPSFVSHPYISNEIISDCMTEVSYDSRFWQNLKPLATTRQWQVLDELSRDERLLFVTHRYERETYSIREITCDWLKKHGIKSPVVYFTQSYKSELVRQLKIELFVDDRHENCLDVAEKTDAVVMMPHRSYNNSFEHPKVQRIHDLEELFSYLSSWA